MLFKKIIDVQNLQKQLDFSCGYPIYPYKKNIVFYTNCHGLVLSELLRHNPEVFEKYNIYLILGYLYEKKDEYNIELIPYNIIHSMISSCDIFIYQNCYNGSELSSELMCSLLKEGSISIRITNPQNTALWAMHFDEDKRNYYNIHEEYVKTMTIFKHQDENSQTPIYRYIVENLRQKKLFIDRPHPTLRVFVEIAKYLWNYLGVKSIDFTDEYLDTNPNPCELPGEIPKIELDYIVGFSI